MTESRFSNAGLHAAETMFVAAHQRAAQYLDQAPVLVLWAMPWTTSDEGRGFARSLIAGRCEAGVTLPAFMRACGLPLPLRRIQAKALRPGLAPVCAALSRIHPSILGRVIPTGLAAQRRWLSALAAWLAAWLHRPVMRDPLSTFQWGAERFADKVGAEQAKDLADFASYAEFNTAWGLPRALEEMERWHARITLERVLRGTPFQANDQIDLGAHPDRWEAEPFEFIALRTPSALCEEGTAMRHCVGTYVGIVVRGGRHIVSIRKNGQRVATLEMATLRGGVGHRVAQLKGPHNSDPGHSVRAVANFYVEMLRHKAEAA